MLPGFRRQRSVSERAKVGIVYDGASPSFEREKEVNTGDRQWLTVFELVNVAEPRNHQVEEADETPAVAHCDGPAERLGHSRCDVLEPVQPRLVLGELIAQFKLVVQNPDAVNQRGPAHCGRRFHAFRPRRQGSDSKMNTKPRRERSRSNLMRCQ